MNNIYQLISLCSAPIALVFITSAMKAAKHCGWKLSEAGLVIILSITLSAGLIIDSYTPNHNTNSRWNK